MTRKIKSEDYWLNLGQKKSQAGFSLVEAVIAVAIITLILGSILAVLHTMVLFEGETLKKRQATQLLDQGMEAVRALRDQSYVTAIASLTTNTTYYVRWTGSLWQATTTPQVSGVFTRSFTLSPVYRDGSYRISSSGTVDTNTKLVTVTVAWPYSLSTSSVSTKGYITNLFND